MKKWIRRSAYVAAAVVVVLIVFAATIYFLSEGRIRKAYTVELATLTIPADEASLARGKHIADIRGCTDCHDADLGGKPFLEDGPVAHLYATNLTRGEGGIGASYTDADWIRAIRHGLGPDGRPLLFMPSYEYQGFSDEDTASLIAYLKSVPPVDRTLPDSRVGPVGRMLFLTGKLPLVAAEVIDHAAAAAAPATVAATADADYGRYLATSCTGCHGPGFSGGPIPGAPPHFPPATNITRDPETGIGAWTKEDFLTALRTGTRPDGSTINEIMPWRVTAKMTDTELDALWAFIQTLPAQPYGNR